MEELKKYNAWYAADTDEKKIYLTFDAGYDNGNMPAILNALHKHQVHATFLLWEPDPGKTGTDPPDRRCRPYRRQSHHTHPDMSGISTKEAFQKQLEDVEVLIRKPPEKK